MHIKTQLNRQWNSTMMKKCTFGGKINADKRATDLVLFPSKTFQLYFTKKHGSNTERRRTARNEHFSEVAANQFVFWMGSLRHVSAKRLMRKSVVLEAFIFHLSTNLHENPKLWDLSHSLQNETWRCTQVYRKQACLIIDRDIFG